MRTIEEQIWDYIDGNITAEEKVAITAKIANDAAYQLVYAEMMDIHQLMAAAELEEPSMSFTRNVMEQVKLEIAPVALKTKTDKRIIYSLAAVFLFSILSVSAYVIANSTLQFPAVEFPALAVNLNADLFTNSLSIQIFLFADVLLGLVYLDKYLRSKRAS